MKTLIIEIDKGQVAGVYTNMENTDLDISILDRDVLRTSTNEDEIQCLYDIECETATLIKIF